MNQNVLLNNEEETKKFAASFAKKLKKGDIIELIGDLGSGKTFFTRALVEALGSVGVSSPSFVIKNEYRSRKFPVQHFDFYRLGSPETVREELEEDIMSRSSLIIIEWAKSVENILPEERYKINFKIAGDNSRKLTISR